MRSMSSAAVVAPMPRSCAPSRPRCTTSPRHARSRGRACTRRRDRAANRDGPRAAAMVRRVGLDLAAVPPWVLLGVLAIAAVLAGILNTLAGAGSLLVVPVLLALGLPAPVANGTLRLGVLAQNAVAAQAG